MPESRPKPALERALELWLYRSRWLLAPIYVGLILTLAAIAVVFAMDVFRTVQDIVSMRPKYVVVATLSMIDLSLAANLVLIVVLSGYEQFIAHIDTGQERGSPSWMGAVDFADLKLKLIASLVAISAVALLRVFVELTDDVTPPDNRTLAWLIGIHLTFVVSGVMLAVMDRIGSKSDRR
jgi:uncharacterized protein (TIGR00645 family)